MAFGDHAAFVMATAQAEESMRLRAEWAVSRAGPLTRDQRLSDRVVRS
jgi:hypothetical protein